MPLRFNLSDDLPASGAPTCAVPVDAPTPDDCQLFFDPSTRQLHIALPDPFAVKAMVGGSVSLGTSDSGLPSLILETDFFWTAAQSETAPWFHNWGITGRVPHRITYENVLPDPTLFRDHFEPDAAVEVVAGAEIGTAQLLDEPIASLTNEYRVKLRVAYSDDASMHPREFLSLLFWRETCDPLLNATPREQYSSALLQKMLVCLEDGADGGYDADWQWLGLRPPLRTSKRTAWEAILSHTLYHDNWQREGNLSGVLRNPLVGGTYAGASKCNIFAGEMAFRSGFRTHVARSGGAGPLQYITRSTLLAECVDFEHDGEAIYTSNRRHPPVITWEAQDYDLNLPYGKKRYVTSDAGDVDQINAEIAEEGKLIIYARKGYCVRRSTASSALPMYAYPTLGADHKEHCPGVCDPAATSPDSNDYEHRVFHVVVLAELARTGSGFDWNATRIFDQHCTTTDIPKFCTTPYCGYSALPGGASGLGRAFTEMIPGGDPTETWGQIDLNCLTRSS